MEIKKFDKNPAEIVRSHNCEQSPTYPPNMEKKKFDKNPAKIVRSHALWGSIVIALPLFGLDWIVYCINLWHMYAKLCKRANRKMDVGSIIVGFIVNIVFAVVTDLALSFIPAIGWLGAFIIAYLLIYFSGKSYIEMLKKINK